jgi:ferredoxin
VKRLRRLVVDPVTCDGHGICAELLPEMIGLDDWGYPMIRPEPVPGYLEAYARRAVSACPTLALHLVEAKRDPDQPV